MSASDHHKQRLEAVKKMSFEQSMDALDEIVKTLESGQQGLEDAIADYEYGNALREHCATLLKNAEMRVQKITKTAGPDGSPIISAEPFEETA